MYAARQEIAAEIENQALQECSNLQSSSPQRELSAPIPAIMRSFCQYHSCSQIVMVYLMPQSI